MCVNKIFALVHIIQQSDGKIDRRQARKLKTEGLYSTIPGRQLCAGTFLTWYALSKATHVLASNSEVGLWG
jgi:hypothetical protein